MTKIIHLTLILSLLVLSRAAIDLKNWELFAEDTIEISIRGQRMGRFLASGEDSNGFPLHIFNRATQTWVAENQRRGNHLQIGLNEDFFSTKTRQIQSRLRGTSGWSTMSPVHPTNFAFNDDPDHNKYMWFIGTPGSPTGAVDGLVYRYDRETLEVANYNSPISHTFAVAPNSHKVWTIRRSDWNILRHVVGRSWVTVPGATARNITFGSTDEPYIVSREAGPEGFLIKKWNATTESWKTIDGISGIFVALDDEDNLYVVTNDKKVYRQRGVPSIYCPMCRENCQTADCTGYEGYCTATRDQCLNCPAGSFATGSLECQSCPAGCEECSSSTTCTKCPENSYLASNGTCLSSCDLPLITEIDQKGNLICKGPCENDSANPNYYPSNNTCQASCGLDIPGEFYKRCDPCPNDCLECSDTTTCTQCISTSFLTPIGTCRPSCPEPLIPVEVSPENNRCEGPCAAETVNIYYHPTDDTCRPACDVPIMTCSALTL